MKSMQELIETSLKDIYSAEKQLLKAMPKLQRKAKHPKLKEMLGTHLTQTENQVKRLEEAAKMMKIKPTGHVCKGMQGLIEEANEHLEEFGGNEVGDAAIIELAQKNEHYEICGYGTLITWCEQSGMNDVANLLKQNLAEEEETDKLLTDLAEGEINKLAIQMKAPAQKPAAKKTSTPRGKATVM